MKKYIIEIELDPVEFIVMAKNQSEARKKGLEKLKKKNPILMISRYFPKNRRLIWIDEL